MAARLRIHRDKDGYLLAEWLTGCILCGVIFSGLCLGVSAFQRILAVAQTESAALEFAHDVLNVRERALTGSDLGYVELRVDRKGYWVCRRPNLVDKSRDFASGGSGLCLRFASIPSYVIKFSVNGSPSSSGKFILEHERIPSARVQIEVQPVTGRVLTERLY